MWGVRVTGIEVIDGDPIELGPEVPFHFPHQVADEWFQIFHAGTVLGRDDEAELVAVALLAREEVASIGIVAVLVVELTRPAVARDAISQDVVLMRTRGTKVGRSVPGNAGLHDHMAHSWSRREECVKRALAARQLGYWPARERVRPPAAFAQAFSGFPGDEFEDALISRRAFSAGPAELRFKAIVCHGG